MRSSRGEVKFKDEGGGRSSSYRHLKNMFVRSIESEEEACVFTSYCGDVGLVQ